MEIKNVIEHITLNTHSSIRIEGMHGVLYVDPIEIPEEVHDADFILVTHDHGDHFSPEAIQKIAKAESILIGPKKMEDKIRSLDPQVGKIETVVPGEHYSLNGLEFDTIPAYNNLKPFHPKKAGWVGYLFSIDGTTVYVAGDTDVTPDNRKVVCDIALVPIGGTFTMDAKKAAELINQIRPKAVIPMHYGTIVGKPADVDAFEPLVDSEIRVEKKLNRF